VEQKLPVSTDVQFDEGCAGSWAESGRSWSGLTIEVVTPSVVFMFLVWNPSAIGINVAVFRLRIQIHILEPLMMKSRQLMAAISDSVQWRLTLDRPPFALFGGRFGSGTL
jgi:hypothetical protein